MLCLWALRELRLALVVALLVGLLLDELQRTFTHPAGPCQSARAALGGCGARVRREKCVAERQQN